MTACLVALGAGPGWAACIDTYPDSQVNQRLAKDAYAACALETMRADYAGILREEARLLALLRPAYERALKNGANLGKHAVQKRLDEFDHQLKELSGLVEAIASTAKAPNKAEKSKGAADGRAVLKRGRDVSELLRSRIAHARASLEPQETDAYCKLDFHFRLGEELFGLTRKCMK